MSDLWFLGVNRETLGLRSLLSAIVEGMFETPVQCGRNESKEVTFTFTILNVVLCLS